MSGLIKKIIDMRGVKVDTNDILNQYYLNELTDSHNIPRKDQHLCLDKDLRNTDKIYIGGYGDIDNAKGAANTRKLQDAEYVLHMFATRSDAMLLPLCGLLGVSSDIKSVRSLIETYKRENADIKTASMINEGLLFLSGSEIGFMTLKTLGTHTLYAEAIITNVHKNIFDYRGDITLHLMKNIGEGGKYLKPEDVKERESLHTDSVLFSRSLAGSSFRREIDNNMELMSNFVDKSKVDYNSKNWLLLVDNI